MVFEVVIFTVPSFRIALLTWNIGDYDTKDVRDFLHSKGVADWFVFYEISKNTDKQFFCLLLENLSKQANKKSTEHNDLKGNGYDTFEMQAKNNINMPSLPYPTVPYPTLPQ